MLSKEQLCLKYNLDPKRFRSLDEVEKYLDKDDTVKVEDLMVYHMLNPKWKSYERLKKLILIAYLEGANKI